MEPNCLREQNTVRSVGKKWVKMNDAYSLKSYRKWSILPVLILTFLFLVFNLPLASAGYGDEVSSFNSPGSDPTGLTWDGSAYWNADADTDMIYRLNTSGDVLTSFDSPLGDPEGLAWDGTYLWVAEGGNWAQGPPGGSMADTVYKLDTAGNIIDNFTIPVDGVKGLTWDGSHLWAADWDTDKIYKLDRYGNVISSFNSPSDGVSGLAWDGTYLWYSDPWEKTYKLDVNGNVIDSFSGGYNSLAWHGGYLGGSEWSLEKIYKISLNHAPALSN